MARRAWRLTRTTIGPWVLSARAPQHRWVDYSHGVRIVSRVIMVDGVKRDLVDLLIDPVWAPLLSDGGVIAPPRYAVPRGPAIVLEYQRHVEPDLPSSPR